MDQSQGETIRVVIQPDLRPDDVAPLANRLAERLSRGDPVEVLVDVGGVESPDMVCVDALARLQLAARRHLTTVRLVGPNRRLLELLHLVGLADVFDVTAP